jgi:formate hydrogenlyase transcriptional activator
MANAANARAREASAPAATAGEMIGGSIVLKRIVERVRLVAPTDATVLIVGESGTGKGRIAAMIHNHSARRNSPFLKVNCAAIPRHLLESELFGRQRGAVAQRIGRFESGQGGTLFLDEMGEIPLKLQPKLLRAVREREFERMSGVRTIRSNVRLIAATHYSMRQMFEAGKFRADFFYRLNAFPIFVPPLRERPEDIPRLVRYFVDIFSARWKRRIEVIPVEVLDALTAHSWPGNVLELEKFIERSVILSPGQVLQAPLEDLALIDEESRPPVTLEDAERAHIRRTLREANGAIDAAAARLDVSQSALCNKMRRLGIMDAWGARSA